MLKQVKRRTFAGAVCIQEVYTVETNRQSVSVNPRLRFKSNDERAAHRLAISRKKHALLVNANFSPASLYSTLTFSNDYDVHDIEDGKILRDKFFRRLKRKYPDAVIFIYIGRGKGTNRIHLHMISDGIPESYIKKQWYYGNIVDIQHLRKHNFYDGIDHGQDYTGLANYLFNHWTPEIGGHRWKATRNAKQPEVEEAVQCKRKYTKTKPPQAPKGYILVDIKITEYGYSCYKYIINPALQGWKMRR